eukprot:15433200-Alexandrium_andersonii.AAC.1
MRNGVEPATQVQRATCTEVRRIVRGPPQMYRRAEGCLSRRPKCSAQGLWSGGAPRRSRPSPVTGAVQPP